MISRMRRQTKAYNNKYTKKLVLRKSSKNENALREKTILKPAISQYTDISHNIS